MTIPVGASAVQVATGRLSVGGNGDAVMTGLGTKSTVEAMTGATIVKGTTGDVDVVDEVTATKNDATTFEGTTDTHTHAAHSHTLAAV
jgi:hypothetical protein